MKSQDLILAKKLHILTCFDVFHSLQADVVIVTENGPGLLSFTSFTVRSTVVCCYITFEANKV